MIHTLLIANRAEISERIARTAHQMGLSTVAVYSDPDATLHFVRAADRAVRLPGSAPSDTYLNIDALLDAAKTSGANAVHPGYGFLSERADFAERVIDAGLIWVGPSPSAIRAMGDKASARQTANQIGVPVLPGYDDADQSESRFIQEANQMGYPLLVKASAGGGGRGMRVVHAPDDLPEALQSARREATNAFGDGALLLEKLVTDARHIEVQIIGDQHGHVVHLGERECSIQRRHQKIIEEAPSPAVSEELRHRLGQYAIQLAHAVGYEGAGTVEFLLTSAGEPYFLEMNTRLQVEHPVTECITGIDLVEWQLLVAQGQVLPCTQQDIQLDGHAIELRVIAEDPNRDYRPASGRLVRADWPEGARTDVGFRTGDTVSIHYDAMLGKIICHGRDRLQATRISLRALNQTWIAGLPSNVALLREILQHPAWSSGELHTRFLEAHHLPSPLPATTRLGTLAAVATQYWMMRDPELPTGWRIGGPTLESDSYQQGGQTLEVTWTAHPRHMLHIHFPETEHPRQLQVHDFREQVLDLTLDGVRQRWFVAHEDDSIFVHTEFSESVVQRIPRFPRPVAHSSIPGQCVAETPGTVRAIHVSLGDKVSPGDPLITLEAMKMEHQYAADQAGTVCAIRVSLEESVDSGVLLIKIEAESKNE